MSRARRARTASISVGSVSIACVLGLAGCDGFISDASEGIKKRTQPSHGPDASTDVSPEGLDAGLQTRTATTSDTTGVSGRPARANADSASPTSDRASSMQPAAADGDRVDGGSTASPADGKTTTSDPAATPSMTDASAASDASTGTGAVGPRPGASYTVTGSWPQRPVAIQQRPGSLSYTKLRVDDRFLAESCSIADYNQDGIPDISAGRRWYEGPFDANGAAREHIFRDGHDELPRTGAEDELYTGVSDDWACYAHDIDGDGYPDIINIACPDVDESRTIGGTSRQRSGTAVWYKNPGATVDNSSEHWQAHPIHNDVRGEQHGLSDVDSDGQPEIYGACHRCDNDDPATVTRGYFRMDPADVTAAWTYHAVTTPHEWPGGGWLHGFGFSDVNQDGQVDFLERDGVWTHVLADTPDTNAHYAVRLYGEGDDPKLGGAHMFATDVDGDGDSDIISTDLAHAYGVSWYEQTAPGAFTRHKFVGAPADDLAVTFSQPHAMEVVDMDGDAVADVIVGKTYLAHPEGLDDPDLRGDPVSYVFKVKRNAPSEAGPVTFEPHLIDTSDAKVGVGRQIAVGHVNTDGIMDVCVASKLGVYVFLGQ